MIPNIDRKLEQGKSSSKIAGLRRLVSVLARCVHGGEIGAVRGATLSVLSPPPDTKQMIL